MTVMMMRERRARRKENKQKRTKSNANVIEIKIKAKPNLCSTEANCLVCVRTDVSAHGNWQQKQQQHPKMGKHRMMEQKTAWIESKRNETKWNEERKKIQRKDWRYSEPNCLKIKSSKLCAHFTIFDGDVHTWTLLCQCNWERERRWRGAELSLDKTKHKPRSRRTKKKHERLKRNWWYWCEHCVLPVCHIHKGHR